MALSAYTGVMGSGKSYEAVASVIIPALELGRRVVTNVNGVSGDDIRQYVAEKTGKDLAEIGEIVKVGGKGIADPEFFPIPQDGEDPEAPRVWLPGKVVRPGDLVVIDEAWEWWGEGCKIDPRHLKYFRMHRHGVDEKSGIAGDIVLIVQDISDLHRSIKKVVDFTYYMQKQKSVGLDRFYRVDVYRGNRVYVSRRQSNENKKYDPAICALYESYQGGKGREVATDRRQNIFASRKLWALAAVMVVAFAVAVYGAVSFFHPAMKPVRQAQAAVSSVGRPGPVVARRPMPAAPAVPPLSERWRLAGRVMIAGRDMVLLSDQSGRLRYEDAALLRGFGHAAVVTVDGERVTEYSGAAAGPQAPSFTSLVPGGFGGAPAAHAGGASSLPPPGLGGQAVHGALPALPAGVVGR